MIPEVVKNEVGPVLQALHLLQAIGTLHTDLSISDTTLTRMDNKNGVIKTEHIFKTVSFNNFRGSHVNVAAVSLSRKRLQ